MTNPIDKAISLMTPPTQVELARRCGVSKVAIGKARRRGVASRDLAEKIHKATGGKVPKEEAVFGRRLRQRKTK
jgi:hypothetical protein